jgi:hypothetical protein
MADFRSFECSRRSAMPGADNPREGDSIPKSAPLCGQRLHSPTQSVETPTKPAPRHRRTSVPSVVRSWQDAIRMGGASRLDAAIPVPEVLVSASAARNASNVSAVLAALRTESGATRVTGSVTGSVTLLLHSRRRNRLCNSACNTRCFSAVHSNGGLPIF